MANSLIEILEEWSISNKIFGLVTDSARNCLAMTSSLKEKLNNNNLIHLSCSAHIINLILKNLKSKMETDTDDAIDASLVSIDETLEENEAIRLYQDLCTKCRKIAAVFHQSNLLSNMLSTKQTELRLVNHVLIQDVVTRWNSTFLMMERIEEQVNAINAVFKSSNLRNKYNDLIIQQEEHTNLIEICNILRYYYDATLILSGSKYVTLSVVYSTFHSLLGSMEEETNDSNLSKTMKDVLKESTNKYWRKYMENNTDILITAAFLDIRTKLFGQLNNKERKINYAIAENSIKNICKNGPNEIRILLETSTSSQASTSAQSNEQQNRQKRSLIVFDVENNLSKNKGTSKLTGLAREIEEYKSEPPKMIEPEEYWKQHSKIYPCLFYAYTKIFSLPATSVPSEELFSHSEHNIRDRRNRLSPQNINKILVIYENI